MYVSSVHKYVIKYVYAFMCILNITQEIGHENGKVMFNKVRGMCIGMYLYIYIGYNIFAITFF